MDSFIELFHIDLKIIIAQVINFAIVIIVLYFFAVKPLRKIMAERTTKIEQGVHDAKTNAELLSATKTEYDAVLARARTEAHEIFQEGKKEAEVKKAEMLAEARDQVEAMIESGKAALEGEKEKMVAEAKKEIVSLVVRATEKLLEENATAEFDQKLINGMKKSL